MKILNPLSLGLSLYAVVCATTAVGAHADSFSRLSLDEANQTLRDLARNPKAFMEKNPEKRNASGQVVHENPLHLSASEQNSGKWAAKKLNDRKNIWAKSGHVSHTGGGMHVLDSINLSTDNAENLVDSMVYRSLSEMDSWTSNVKSARLPIQPWSSTYWPTYLGMGAYRFSDPSFPESKDWNVNSSYINDHLGQASYTAYLSPAEKYDLVVGDSNFSLTKASLAVGASLQSQFGSVADWQGICHGWSSAAVMLPRPTKGVNMLSVNQQSIPFYPDDIKALASMLWANANYVTKIAGKRCDIANPDFGSRSSHPECWDNNPATFHLGVVNQIAGNQRGLILDATWDSEVWNQPILGYSYSYFNPATLSATDNLSSATVGAGFAGDRFSSTRSSGASSVVGIVMNLTYMQETQPTLAITDSPNRDATHTVRYVYDLEIDGSGRIIGGEWYQKNHPDFLWVPAKGSRAVSQGEALVTSSVTAAAQTASQNNQPLATIVEQLIRYSNR